MKQAKVAAIAAILGLCVAQVAMRYGWRGEPVFSVEARAWSPSEEAIAALLAQARPPPAAAATAVTTNTTQTISGAKTFSSVVTSNVGSGSNGFACTTNGCRFDFGAGASDYFSSNGTTVTAAGPFAASGLTTSTLDASGIITSTVASASRAIQLTTGALLDLGTGSGDSMVSWGNGVDFAGTWTAPTLVANTEFRIPNAGQGISGMYRGTGTLDFASAPVGACSSDLTITVTGATTTGNTVLGVPNGSVPAGSQFFAWVSASNTVTVRHCCVTGTSCDPASGTFSARVFNP